MILQVLPGAASPRAGGTTDPMTDDEDKTPPRQPTPRAYRLTDSERDVRRGLRTPRGRTGVPVVMPDAADEITAPIELLLNGQLTTEDYAQIAALEQAGIDLRALILNLAKALSRYREEDKSGSRAVEKQVVAAIAETQRQLGELGRRIDAVVADRVRFATQDQAAELRGGLGDVTTELGERHTETKGSVHENLSRLLSTRRTAIWLLSIALTAALGSVTYVVTEIKGSGADAVRLQRAERDLEQQQQDIRDIRRELRRKDSQ